MHSKEGDIPINQNLFELASRQVNPISPFLHVFKDCRQEGELILFKNEPLFTEDKHFQRTLHVLEGTARMQICHQEYEVKKGHIVVVPSKTQVTFSDMEKSFLTFSLASLEPDSEHPKDSSIVVANLFDLYNSTESKPFMSTSDANGERHSSSKVAEIPVFSPEMAEEGYALGHSQAARLLIYEEAITLDRHTHPKAQHAITVLSGHGTVEFEGKKFDLTAGGLFVVPPKTRHQLGSYGDFLAFVVNTPGIPSTHPHYSQPA